MGTLNNGLTGGVCCRVRCDRPDSESSNAVTPCLDCIGAVREHTMKGESDRVGMLSRGESSSGRGEGRLWLALRTGISLTVAHTRLHHHSRTLAVDIAHRVPEDLSWPLDAMDCTRCKMGNAEPERPVEESKERSCLYGVSERGRTLGILCDLSATC